MQVVIFHLKPAKCKRHCVKFRCIPYGAALLVLQLRIKSFSSVAVGRERLVYASPSGPRPYEAWKVLSSEYELCDEPADFRRCEHILKLRCYAARRSGLVLSRLPGSPSSGSRWIQAARR